MSSTRRNSFGCFGASSLSPSSAKWKNTFLIQEGLQTFFLNHSYFASFFPFLTQRSVGCHVFFRKPLSSRKVDLTVYKILSSVRAPQKDSAETSSVSTLIRTPVNKLTRLVLTLNGRRRSQAPCFFSLVYSQSHRSKLLYVTPPSWVYHTLIMLQVLISGDHPLIRSKKTVLS